MDWLGENVSQARFAAMVGISEARASQLVSDGLLVKGRTAGEWLLVYCGHLREQAAGRAGIYGEGGADLAAERSALTKVRRQKEQLLLAELAGDLMRVEAVRNVFAKTFVSVRDGFLNLPARLAPTLAAETDMHKVHDLLDLNIRETLTTLANA